MLAATKAGDCAIVNTFLPSPDLQDGRIGSGKNECGSLAANAASAFLYQPERNRCICPEGKVLLPQARRKVGAGMTYHLYEARFEDCRSCPRKPECCPDNKKNGRSVAQLEESPVVMAFRKKMASEEVQERYRRRGRIVEFCHAWIKSKLGLRQFHVRGLKKVQMEMLWACLTYNLQFWIRLSKHNTSSYLRE
jgi:Transposase DDE domain